ncbi:hypothetical protein [Alicyclobacillus sp.]|uniref:hypothetical protein n=1 Tax=Alicyclobacillus sp. TaxID=61169 RepID=UPI0025BF3DE3|nr:hypothetical protein [Alicyclobacillus sp.]
MGWWIGVLVSLAVAAAAFAAGRRSGIRLGRSLGLAEAPIALRERALREGVCPICDVPAGAWYNGQAKRDGLARDGGS